MLAVCFIQAFLTEIPSWVETLWTSFIKGMWWSNQALAPYLGVEVLTDAAEDV